MPIEAKANPISAHAGIDNSIHGEPTMPVNVSIADLPAGAGVATATKYSNPAHRTPCTDVTEADTHITGDLRCA